jgi:hypothetical protein
VPAADDESIEIAAADQLRNLRCVASGEKAGAWPPSNVLEETMVVTGQQVYVPSERRSEALALLSGVRVMGEEDLEVSFFCQGPKPGGLVLDRVAG